MFVLISIPYNAGSQPLINYRQKKIQILYTEYLIIPMLYVCLLVIDDHNFFVPCIQYDLIAYRGLALMIC